MPRQARLDAPGTLHHVMGRGIDRTAIFGNDADRDHFVRRAAELCQDVAFAVYAWALMPNHFHLLVRTGATPLGQSMQRLLTGYVVSVRDVGKWCNVTPTHPPFAPAALRTPLVPAPSLLTEHHLVRRLRAGRGWRWQQRGDQRRRVRPDSECAARRI